VRGVSKLYWSPNLDMSDKGALLVLKMGKLFAGLLPLQL